MEKLNLPAHSYKYWTGLIRPKGFETDKDSLTAEYGKFYIRPLERGYGLTLGNAVRRVLLSSMMGSAVSAVRFEGVLHEFSVIKGVLEDVTDLIFNLKAVRFRQSDPDQKTVKLSKKGPGEVKASDLKLPGGLEILNPDAHIASLSKDGALNAEILVAFDRGYIEASSKEKDLPVDFIPVDSLHSPVRRVNCRVESARVGQRTDYDSLILEVWTDGSLRPEEAVPLGYKILKDQLQVFMNFDEGIEPEVSEKEEAKKKLNAHLFHPAEELELSVRSANCLKNARIRYIGDLVTKTEADMLKTKNFGRKSLNEIKAILSTMGLSLGMKIDGWPPKDFYDEHSEDSVHPISRMAEGGFSAADRSVLSAFAKKEAGPNLGGPNLGGPAPVRGPSGEPAGGFAAGPAGLASSEDSAAPPPAAFDKGPPAVPSKKEEDPKD